MISLDSTLLAALAQPCVGAFIGYLTNKIAIRMLFRPLRPWYVFKWRVPLTPGIIPSKRHELAANIGEMVGMRLLTSEEIGRAISGEAFQEHLHNLITRRLNLFWHKELPSLQELFPAGSSNAVSALQASLSKERLSAILPARRQGYSLQIGCSMQATMQRMSRRTALCCGRWWHCS